MSGVDTGAPADKTARKASVSPQTAKVGYSFNYIVIRSMQCLCFLRTYNVPLSTPGTQQGIYAPGANIMI